MKNNKVVYFIVFMLLIISSFMINPMYCKYASNHQRTVTINIRKPNYTVIFNSNAPSGANVTGTVEDQHFTYGISQNLHTNNYIIDGYEFVNWKLRNEDRYFSNNENVTNLTSTDNSNIYLDAVWHYLATPIITRIDYNTFSYSGTNAKAYYISKSNTAPSAGTSAASSSFALNTWTTANNTGDLALAAGEVYYVWMKDAITGGNVSSNKASIVVRTVTRTQGTGTTLTTRYDSSSGASFTNDNNYVLDGTNVYIEGTLAAGYNTLVLKKDGTVVSAGNYTINNNTNFESSATLNKVTLTINKDGSLCTTCNGYTVHISTSSSSDTATWTGTTTTLSTSDINGAMTAGTIYYVWVGEDSNNKSTMKYSGVSFTGAPAATATINFYTITGSLSNSAMTFNGTALANGGTVVALGSTSAIHSIVATANTGYNLAGTIWTSSNTSSMVTSATSASTTFKAGAATTLKATATINKVTLTIKKDGANCTTCNGYTVHISTSSSSDTSSWATTTTTASTLAINGTMAAGTTYYVWVGEDANHKSTMKYSGVSFTGGAAATATINFYTITVSLTNSTMKFNGTTIANNGTVVALGSTSAIHSIVATPTSGYGFSKWQSSNSNTTITSATSASTTLSKTGAATTLTAYSYRYLVDVVSVGNYVNYPITYTNKNGDASALASTTGWRVLSKSGSGASGYVILVSAGTPLTYNYTAKTATTANETAAENEIARLRGTTDTGFFSVGMNTSTLTNKYFHQCGFSGITSTDALRQLFINNYTQVNTYNNVQYPKVRAMYLTDLNNAYRDLTGNQSASVKAHETNLSSYNLLALTSTTSGKKAPYVLASKVKYEVNGTEKYYLRTVYDQGIMVETSGDKAIRLVVYLKAGILTSSGSGTSGSPRAITW